MKCKPPTLPVISQTRAPDQPCLLKCDCPVRELNDVKGHVVNPVSKDVICVACTEVHAVTSYRTYIILPVRIKNRWWWRDKDKEADKLASYKVIKTTTISPCWNPLHVFVLRVNTHSLRYFHWWTPKHEHNEALIALGDRSFTLIVNSFGLSWDLFGVFTVRKDEKDKVDNESSQVSL